MSIAGKPEIIDVFFLILFLRIIYIAASRGVLRETCKIIGLLCAAFFAFHFYPNLSEVVGAKVRFIKPDYLYFVSFFFIFIAVKIAFSLLNLTISLFLPKGEVSNRKRMVLLGAGVFRSFLLFSTIFFSLNLFSFNPSYIKNSLSYNLSKKIAPKLYLISAKIFKKFNQDFEINKKVEGYLERNKEAEEGPVRI